MRSSPWNKILICTLLLASPLAHADEASDRLKERRTERLETQISELKKEQQAQKRSAAAASRELLKATQRHEKARRALEEYESTKSPDEASPEYLKKKNELANAASALEQLKTDLATSKEEDLRIRSEVESLEDKIDRLARAPKKDEEKKLPEPGKDCPTCGNKPGAPNQAKSGWETFADVIKAATPLGLGAMNTYGGVQAMKTQSSDYRYYNDSNTALGLPSSPPTGYSGILGSMMGSNSSLSSFAMMGGSNSSFGMQGQMSFGGMGGMGQMGQMNFGGMGSMNFGSYGMGGMGQMGQIGQMNFGGMGGMNSYNPYAQGYGYNGYSNNNYGYAGSTNPYANPYQSNGVSPSGYGGMNYYNPYYSTYNSQLNSGGLNSFYQNQVSQSQAAIRAAQQQTVMSQDASVAQQSLNDAYSRYGSVLQQMNGTYNTGYSGYGTTYPTATGINQIRQ